MQIRRFPNNPTIRPHEGGHLPRAASVRGLVSELAYQLRDPAIFREHGHTYLFYTVADERGIAVAELII